MQVHPESPVGAADRPTSSQLPIGDLSTDEPSVNDTFEDVSAVDLEEATQRPRGLMADPTASRIDFENASPSSDAPEPAEETEDAGQQSPSEEKDTEASPEGPSHEASTEERAEVEEIMPLPDRRQEPTEGLSDSELATMVAQAVQSGTGNRPELMELLRQALETAGHQESESAPQPAEPVQCREVSPTTGVNVVDHVTLIFEGLTKISLGRRYPLARCCPSKPARDCRGVVGEWSRSQHARRQRGTSTTLTL